MTRRATFWGALALCAGCALILSFNDFMGRHNGDSVMPSLVSLLRWTPFFWAQNYYGMLWPFVLQPVTHPLANLVLSNALSVGATAGAMWAMASYFTRSRFALASAATCMCLFMCCAPAYYIFFNFSPAAFYPTGLFLGTCGLLLLDRPRPWRLVSGALLLAASCWVNKANGVWLLVVMLARGDIVAQLRVLVSSRQRLIQPLPVKLAGISGATLFGFWLSGRFPANGPTLAWVPLTQWPHALHTTMVSLDWVLQTDAPKTSRAIFLGLLAASLGVLAVKRPAARRRLIALLPGAAYLVACVLPLACLFCTQVWAYLNKYDGRYLSPLVLIVGVYVACLWAEPVLSALTERRRQAFSFAWVALAWLSCVVYFGMPSPGVMRRNVDRATGAISDEVLRARVDFLAGEYFAIWPAVFHANVRLYEAGIPRKVYGITHRSYPLFPVLPALRNVQVGVPFGQEPEAVHWLRGYGFPAMHKVRQTKSMSIYHNKTTAPSASN